MSMTEFWAHIDSQVERLRTADTIEQVKKILDEGERLGTGEHFFQGDGSELLGALYEAGWQPHRYVAEYYWVVKSKGKYVAYTEGDVDYRDNPACGGLA